MALLKIRFNEGSLLRRTLLHVGTFVVGTIAFISLVSFLLVSVVKGLLPREGAAADTVADQQGDDSSKPGKQPALKPTRKPLPGAPSKDD